MPEQLITERDLIPKGATVVLRPYGFVHLQCHNADDLAVVNCARVSLSKRSEWVGKVDGAAFETMGEAADYAGTLEAEDPDRVVDVEPVLGADDDAVLRFLMKNKHGTPFEQNFFRWHIRAPIFVFREWHRHRIGWSYNEESARYVKLQPHFYIPRGAFVRTQVGKPGRYTYEPMEGDEATGVASLLDHVYTHAYTVYEDLMKQGVAKEIARAALPVGIYSQMIASCNARSLMNFFTLRNAPSAMAEIRAYAEAMEEIFARVMPITHSAFQENGRVAP